ncbi:MAG: phage major capsid protein [Alphaproteobacteria bacterium]|nr:phage major capsid protein [Alphaproteobacteria bacterium]
MTLETKAAHSAAIPPLEHKAEATTAASPNAWDPQSAELRDAFGEFLSAFEHFKDANDTRLSQIEKRMSSDVVTSDKVDRINAAMDEQKHRMDELLLKSSRPGRSGVSTGMLSHSALEHKRAWDGYMRKGDALDLRALEVKALSTQTDPDGGYLVPSETESEIGRVLSEASPIRAISDVRQVSGSSLKKPIATAGAMSGWVGEEETRPETAAPVLSEMEFPTMELYAMPAATQSLLDDSAVNIEEWLASEVQIAFAEQEGTAFVNGDGIRKPRGFLSYDVVDDDTWNWGKLGYVPSGSNGAFATSNPEDALVDLVYSLKSGYRSNANWVMNRSTQSEIRKFKDADGNYLWQPGLVAGQPATLLNFAITEAEDMPDIATDANALAFGDFRRGYLVVDRLGVRTLRDPYTRKPYVLFYTTKRVGGGVQNFEAIKLMKFAAS